MARNIVVCSDGTGNTANKGRGTNVFKLYEAVDVSGPDQIALYDDGVGTQKLRVVRLAAGAVGYGVSRNVQQLYGDICRVYRPGDRIYLFGFSRGAFTVRTLAGLISKFGILKVGKQDEAELRAAVADRYRQYRKEKPALLERGLGLFTEAFRRLWRGMSPRPEIATHDGSGEVEFLGVWDTVDAVGFPIWGMDLLWNKLFYRFKFTNTELPDGVVRARHALAIDEERGPFAPLLWQPPAEGNDLDPCGEPRIEQVWFSGVHSDIGGGYPKQGLSMIALDWMMSEAAAGGSAGRGSTHPGESGRRLVFRQGVRQQLENGGNADGYIHDSRAGAGIYYRYKPRSIQRLSDRPTPLSTVERIKALFERRPAGAGSLIPEIHHTAIERIRNRTQGYAPGNLPSKFYVVDRRGERTLVDLAPGGSERRANRSAEPSLRAAAFATTHKWLLQRRWVQVGFFVGQALVLVAAVTLTTPAPGDSGLVHRSWSAAREAAQRIPGRLPYTPEAVGPDAGIRGYPTRLAGWAFEATRDVVAPVPTTLVEEKLIPPLFGHPWLGAAFVLLFPMFYGLGLVGRTRMEAIQTRAWLNLEDRLRVLHSQLDASEAGETAPLRKDESPDGGESPWPGQDHPRARSA